MGGWAWNGKETLLSALPATPGVGGKWAVETRDDVKNDGVGDGQDGADRCGVNGDEDGSELGYHNRCCMSDEEDGDGDSGD